MIAVMIRLVYFLYFLYFCFFNIALALSETLQQRETNAARIKCISVLPMSNGENLRAVVRTPTVHCDWWRIILRSSVVSDGNIIYGRLKLSFLGSAGSIFFGSRNKHSGATCWYVRWAERFIRHIVISCSFPDIWCKFRRVVYAGTVDNIAKLLRNFFLFRNNACT